MADTPTWNDLPTSQREALAKLVRKGGLKIRRGDPPSFFERITPPIFDALEAKGLAMKLDDLAMPTNAARALVPPEALADD